jgi:hypothetical protein
MKGHIAVLPESSQCITDVLDGFGRPLCTGNVLGMELFTLDVLALDVVPFGGEMNKHKMLLANGCLCLDKNDFILRESTAFESAGNCAQ